MGKLKIKNETFFEKFQQQISNSSLLTFATSILLILVGCVTGAGINMISNDWNVVKEFVIWGLSGILIVTIGFVIFLPYWRFKKKYSFLDDESDELAKKLVNINNRAQTVVTSIDGVLAFQLFTVERHTNDEHILFKFKELFSHKAEGFDLSSLNPKKLEVPLSLFMWMKNPDSPPKNYSQFIMGMIYEWLMLFIPEKQDPPKKIKQFYKVEIPLKRVSGVHFVEFSDLIEVVNSDNFNAKKDMDNVFVFDYNGEKNSHSNRRYYILRTVIPDKSYGALRCTALVITNKNLTTDLGVVKVLQRVLNGK